VSPAISTAAQRIGATARGVVAKFRPESLEARRTLPIRRSPDEIRGRWDDAAARASILDGIPVSEATLETSVEDRDWGVPATVALRLAAPMPGMAAQAAAGKVVRRLKALCETGEIPTTDFNPSAREDAGEPAS
jgi:hypothetical protein